MLTPPHQNARRSTLSGLSGLTLLLAAVLVVAASPAFVSARTLDPRLPVSGSHLQVRHIVPVVARTMSRAVRKDQYRPLAAYAQIQRSRPDLGGQTCCATTGCLLAPYVAPTLEMLIDLPPPVVA